MKQFFKKKMNVVRFSTEEPTKVSVSELIEGLTTHGFCDVTNMDVNCGFVTFENPYEDNPKFVPENRVFGNYFVGLFRIDKRSVPSSALKKEVAEASKRELENSGKQFLTRARKKEITEQVKTRLLARVIPNVSFIPFVVDMTNGNGYFFNTSKSNFDLFEDLFERAYGSMILFKKVWYGDYNSETGEVTNDLIGVEDFLTYIWWDSESNSFSEMMIGDKLVKTWVGNKICTKSEEQTLSASGENIEEAKLAISKGADVTKLELWLQLGEDEIKFVINQEGAISGLTYSEDLLPDDESPYLLPFITWTNEVFEVVDLWKKRYLEASDNGKGLTSKIRETWGRGDYCSKAFENV